MTDAVDRVRSGVAETVGKAKFAGPLDKLRSRRPEQYNQAEWDATINELNQEYTHESKGNLGFGTPRAKKIANFGLNDIAGAGKKSGALKFDQREQDKKDAVTQIKGSARNLTNAEQGRLDTIDRETEAANRSDTQDLRDLKGVQSKASADYHQTAGNVRRNAEDANKKTEDLLAGLGKDYFALNQQDQNALADYLSATDPMMGEILARSSDPADLQRQLDAYSEQKGAVDKYKSLTDPEVTGKERYMSELARREFEASDKSNREAVSEQLANRGLRSGGQQIAGQQSTQQQLSQDRLLKELGIQAGAVDRSMQAMEGYSAASGRLGEQSNAIRSADDSQRQYEDTFKMREAERRSKLAGERNTAVTDTTDQVGTRDKGYFDAGEAAATTTHDRTATADEADWQATDNDSTMGGDYFDKSTGISGSRISRAVTGADAARTIGTGAHERLINALGIGVDKGTDDEERDLNA